MTGQQRRRRAQTRRRWLLFGVVLLIAVIDLVPIGAVVVLALTPNSAAPGTAISLSNFTQVLQESPLLSWLGNSVLLSGATMVAAVAVAAPAGYVLSRGRHRLVSGFSLSLFVVQALPAITAIIPLFVVFARLHLVDSLFGLSIIYVSGTAAVATWMMASYMDSIPISLEEAAWIDGASLFGGFVRIVLRNSLPGILSSAIFAFLASWNDFLIVSVFIHSNSKYTLPLGLETYSQQTQTEWGSVMAISLVMLIPPVILFASLHRYFSVGGIGGSLGSQ